MLKHQGHNGTVVFQTKLTALSFVPFNRFGLNSAVGRVAVLVRACRIKHPDVIFHLIIVGRRINRNIVCVAVNTVIVRVVRNTIFILSVNLRLLFF